MQLQYLILLLTTIITLAIGVVLLLNKKASNATSLSIIAAAVAAWIISYLLNRMWQTPLSLDILTSVNYLSSAVAAAAQFYFSLSYANRMRWMNRITVGFLLLQPVATQIIYWTESLRNTIFNGEYRIGEQVNTIYVFSLLAGSIILLIDIFAHRPRIHFWRASTIMLGAILTFLGHLSTIFNMGLETNILISIFCYSLAIAGFSYGLFNSHLIESTPITRDVVVEGMDDGWMVIDGYDKVIDLNSSAEKMIGLSRENTYGQPINQILNDWPTISKSSDGVKEIELRRSVKTQQDWRYLNVRISQLSNKNNTNFGHLIVWRDITGRKLADDARQRTRDELFVLLNAVSSAASRSINMEEFLSEASYQILYSFYSQVAAVFLVEESGNSQQNLVLKSQFGIAPDYVMELNNQAITSATYNWLMHNEENRPLVVDNSHDSTDIPLNLKNIGCECIVINPLVIYTQHEKTVIGCILLGRNENIIYSQDEVTRLTTISNQVAALIDGNRRRQFAIALSERQRLLRDLHDSVSQKLYGLVALTEAAQAGVEAGSAIAPLQVLTRIGENARQAVKEMRLFLYEMQPIDLKDGLVSSLHHRLAAVEGRADIKARLLADENIQLTKDQEIALYYIAQEALNNILRHAHAKTVAVNLKQTRQNVVLKIMDDGRGFDIKKIDQGGLGLRNMKERALQANGKFKIISTPGAGTKITVTVSRKS